MNMVDSHFTANGFSGKVSQQTRKVSQQFCQNNKTFFNSLIIFLTTFDPSPSKEMPLTHPLTLS